MNTLKYRATFAAVALTCATLSSAQSQPSHGPTPSVDDVKIEMPNLAGPQISVSESTPDPKNPKLKWIREGYFDAGYERLLGIFSTQILRYGVRYGQDDVHAYVRNETFNTEGTGLPYPQAITGTSVGLQYRHWFPGDKMFATASIGDGLGGFNKGKTDVRYGLVGYTNWTHDSWFSDIYGELFYIALATDTFFDARLRSGRIWHKDKKGYVWGYLVGQAWLAGQVESPTENRFEFGPGIGYVFQNAISINFELRGGYAFRSGVDDGGDRAYFNPTLIISGGFYH